MTVDGPEAIDRHPHGWNEVEGGRERLSWYARNGGGAVMGRKSQRPLPGQDWEPVQAGSSFGQTSHIEDAGGPGLCENL